MTERTIDAIYLRSSSNYQGGHICMNLNTGMRITTSKVTAIPITDIVKKKVEDMALKQGINKVKFTNKKGLDIPNSDWIAGVDYDKYYDEENISDEEDEAYDTEDEESDEEFDEEIDQEELDNVIADKYNTVNNTEEVEEDSDHRSDIDIDTLVEEIENDFREIQEEREELVPDIRRSTRDRRPVERLTYIQRMQEAQECKFNLFSDNISAENTLEYEESDAYVMARFIEDYNNKYENELSFGQQYSLKKGLLKFGKDGQEAAIKEVKQWHDRRCFEPINIGDLNNNERRRAQIALAYLTQKRDGNIKGRTVYNGKPTREWLTKQDSASPTVSLESLMLTAVIDAHEGRDIMTADVPNAFIQTPLVIEDGEDRVIMKITGALVNILIKINPDLYKGYVVCERGEEVIYVNVLKAIYGMLIAELLFYKKFRSDLESIDFIFNPYDPCVANRIIKGSQHTIRFHVDDVMSSHVDPGVNDEFFKWLNKTYGDHGEVEATRGDTHEYLGMTFDFKDGKLIISMHDYIKDMLEEFPIKFGKDARVATPANSNLFKEDNSKKLDQEKRELFHRMVAKGLFLTKRARPDILPTISVLCTRVKAPGQVDWQTLVRLMKYLHYTSNDKLILKAGDLSVVEWYVDAAFAVHPDFKSHTGGVMKFKNGLGSIQNISTKQKLNANSSTVAELIGVDDVMPLILWTPLFLEAQGYSVKQNKLFQDNKSTILLEKNGKRSSGKRTRALNIRYFYITDQVEKGHIVIEHKPDEDMIADYMSKSLQGTKFNEFRNDIMGKKSYEPKEDLLRK